MALAEENGATAREIARQQGPSACSRQLPGCKPAREASEAYFTLRTVAVGLWIGAGVVGAGTTVYLLVRPPSGPSTTASVGVGGTW